MQGIETAKRFYDEAFAPMIARDFAQYADRIAVGLVGHGSECFGFDDEVSMDHDFEPSLCIWLTDEDEREFGFSLFRAYTKLCREYVRVKTKNSLGGADGRGVMTISDFYKRYTGRPGAPETLSDWVYIPSHFLAEATNGAVFADALGQFTAIRNEIKCGMPEDARLKRIASAAFYMAQAGQYNYKRCLLHGEEGAARIALADFAKSAIDMTFLLNKAHAPYYKWSFRAMRDLPIMSENADKLEHLITMPSAQNAEISQEIEAICSAVIAQMRKQNITDSPSDFLEGHAYSINGRIRDSALRNSPVML